MICIIKSNLLFISIPRIMRCDTDHDLDQLIKAINDEGSLQVTIEHT